MGTSSGTTLLETVAVLAVVGVLAAVVVPGAAEVAKTFAAQDSAQRLALVLRSAQVRAQERGAPVVVAVGSSGEYAVSDSDGTAEGQPVLRGDLGVAVSSTYPAGVVAFASRGWPVLPGTNTPRAGHFALGEGGRSRTVVVQLAGCVRCQ
jgi:type II secretory pathway pseudopilin PulG